MKTHPSFLSSLSWQRSRLHRLFFVVLTCIALCPAWLSAQNDTPCECSQRWTEAGAWNANGTVDDSPPNALQPKGVLKCSPGAETQSDIMVEYNCTYNPNPPGFQIVLPAGGCTGGQTTPTLPTAGKPIIWFNFDLRPSAGSFTFQWNDNDAADNIGWALYYSTAPTTGAGAAPHYQSGNCASLALFACGSENGNTFTAMMTPVFSSATNFYLAMWDQSGDDDLDI
ncbi:MAG: hypothetical protein AAB316_17210, partial [Bacteroidota bacterium]